MYSIDAEDAPLKKYVERKERAGVFEVRSMALVTSVPLHGRASGERLRPVSRTIIIGQGCLGCPGKACRAVAYAALCSGGSGQSLSRPEQNSMSNYTGATYIARRLTLQVQSATVSVSEIMTGHCY